MDFQLSSLLVLPVILVAAIALIFYFALPASSVPEDLRVEFSSSCSGQSLTLSVQSLEVAHIPAVNITVLENGAPCVSSVPYYIVNTQGRISCVGSFERGKVYTVLIGGRALRVRC